MFKASAFKKESKIFSKYKNKKTIKARKKSLQIHCDCDFDFDFDWLPQ